MGGCEVQLNPGKSSGRRLSSLQIVRNGGCIKPRIIHTYSPKVYKIKPEEFLNLVQKLTGRPAADEVTSKTYQFLGNDFNSERSGSEDCKLFQRAHHVTQDEIVKPCAEALGTPVSNELLASLTAPRLVTLNFFPMLSSSPRTFSQPSRDQGFTFSSAAYWGGNWNRIILTKF
jgi:hypothetical protein